MIAVLLVAATFAMACENADRRSAQEALSDAQRRVQDAQEQLQDFRTEADQLVQQVQEQRPEAKEALLTKCRDVATNLSDANRPSADKTATLCDKIENTNLENSQAWQDIKQEFDKLTPGQNEGS